MALSGWFALVLAVLAFALAALMGTHSGLTRARGGKILAFLAIFLLPAAALWGGFQEQMQRSESTQFCLSCHVMHDFGVSLQVDDASYIPAVHYQNHLVPHDAACYTCHTDYALFGGLQAKMHGLRHVYVEYLGHIPQPDQIRLYTPYNNRECLHCHAGMRVFLEAKPHQRTPGMMQRILNNQVSCVNSGCHDTIHDVGNLKGVALWKGSN